MSEFFDELETQDATAREQHLLGQLPELIARAKADCDYYRSSLIDVDPQTITSREALEKLPILRKSSLIKLQQQQYPFAGINSNKALIERVFQSPGPIYDPQGSGSDYWRTGRAFYAAGFRQGDLVQNCLSYHLTPGGFILDAGAKACGCSVIPAGPGQTEQQLEVIKHLKPQGYCGTPSFLNILRQKGDISSIKKALVTGEALPESLRLSFEDSGISVLQAYANADAGLIAYESKAKMGMIVAEDIIVEIVRPGTNKPVSEGEVGEIVITCFNEAYPLIRFATGDLSAVLPGQSPCGRTNMMIKGWLGRADQTTKVKGMFVHPEQIEQIVCHYPSLNKARLVVSSKNHNDEMLLICESSEPESINEAELRDRIKAVTKLTGRVKLVGLNCIANDGKVIEDLRVYN